MSALHRDDNKYEIVKAENARLRAENKRLQRELFVLHRQIALLEAKIRDASAFFHGGPE